jgi:predicted PurR-regulated permease PerM
MISSLDLLYLVLSIAVIVLTVVMVILGIQLSNVLREVQRTAESVEQISTLLSRLSEVLLGGAERGAKRLDGLGQKLGDYIEKNIEKIVTKH